MNRWLVGICAAIILLLAMHYGVFKVDMTALHNNVWPLIEWFADNLGKALIVLCLSKIQKSNPIS